MSDLHARFTPVWGPGITYGSDGYLNLSAPRNAKDGIGSALAVSDADLLAEGPVRVSWEVMEHWGGEESWRGFWLMFVPPTALYPYPLYYPMHYYRPTPVGFEIGEVAGGAPADQHIWATWVTGLLVVSRFPATSAKIAASDGAVHIWSQDRGTISLPIGPRLLGLYCEACECRVRVERG